jgi:hypothetical protein
MAVETKRLRAVIANFNDILTPLYPFFDIASPEELANDEKTVDVLLVWNDVLPDYQMMCAVANMHGIPTFVVQHGRGGMRDYLDGLHRPWANAAFVWGEKDKEIAIKGGWKPEQVFRVGAPWFTYRPAREQEEGLVVFDAVHWQGEVKENYEVWSELLSIPEITPVAKLINEHNPEMFPGNWLQTDRFKEGHLEDTFTLLKKASAVVCMLEGTMELMAYSLGIPVIHVDHFKHRKLEGTHQGEEDTKPSAATIPCTLKTLKETLLGVLENPGENWANRRDALLDFAGDPDKDTPISTMVSVIYGAVKEIQAKDPGVA